MNNFLKKLSASAVAFVLMGTCCLAAESSGTTDPVSGKPCYSCHLSQLKARLHGALSGKECTPCHVAAGGDHQKNHGLYSVKKSSAELCQQCHRDFADQKSVHPIISAKGCLDCHAPHNSPLDKLLRAEVPGLCFQCHSHGIVEERETLKATNFRDGSENLHYVHAGEKSGIPCLTCHDVHASSQLHLIRAAGTRSKAAPTLTYLATENGGNCAASCHEAEAYLRN